MPGKRFRQARVVFTIQQSIDMEGGPDRDFASIVQAEAAVRSVRSVRMVPRDEEPAGVVAAFLVRPRRAGQHGILDECAEVGGDILRRTVEAVWDADGCRLRPDILWAMSDELLPEPDDPAILAIDPIVLKAEHRGEALGLRAVRCVAEAFGGAACLLAGIVRPVHGPTVRPDFGVGADGQAERLRAYWGRLGRLRQAEADPAVCWLLRTHALPDPRQPAAVAAAGRGAP